MIFFFCSYGMYVLLSLRYKRERSSAFIKHGNDKLFVGFLIHAGVVGLDNDGVGGRELTGGRIYQKNHF